MFGKVVTYVVSFFMLRYYTKNISPAAYGDYEYLYSLINVIVPALFVEIWSGLLRFAVGGGKEEKTTALSTIFLMTFPVLLVYSAVYFVLNSVFGFPQSTLVYIFACMILLVNMMMMVSRAFEKNLLFALSGIIGGLSNAAIGVFCVHVLKLQSEAMMLAMIGNYAMQVIILACGTKVWRYIRLRYASKKMAKEVLLYCLPFLPNTVLYYVNTDYYRVVVRNVLGSEALGIFVASTKFCVIVTFVVSVFHLAWQEISYSIAGNQDKKTVYRNGLQIFSDLAMIGTLLLLPLVKVLFPYFIGEEFASANAYVPFYYVTVYFTSLSGFLYNTLAAEKITVFHPITKLFSGAANMLFLYLLIGRIEIYAVVVGAVVGAVVEMLLMLVLIRKKIGVGMKYYMILVFVALYAVGAVVYASFGIGINMLYMLVILLAGAGYLGYTNRSMVKNLVANIRKR